VRSHAKASSAGVIKRWAPPARKRFARVTIAIGLLLAFGLLLPSSAALAAHGHLFLETFGSANQPSFPNPVGLAIDQSSGDLLVIDRGAGTVSRYNPDGTPASFSALGSNVIDGKGAGDETPEGGLFIGGSGEVQVAVDNSGGITDGNIYVTSLSFPRAIQIFASDGHYLGHLTASSEGTFSYPCGVAVDPSGNVYVGDYGGGGYVHKYVPSASPPVDADNTANFPFASLCTLAAGAGPTAGSIFPAHYNGALAKLDSASGKQQYVVSESPTTTETVDPATGHLYVASGSQVDEYDASGPSATLFSSLSVGGGVNGIAVRAATGNLYLSRSGTSQIEVFGPAVLLPDASTGEANPIGFTKATLNGTVSAAGGPAATCQFQYVDQAGFQANGFQGAASAPCQPAGPFTGSGEEAVSAALSGLTGETTYHYRLLATNENGDNPAAEKTFTTSPPANVKTGEASNLGKDHATLNATITPEGNEALSCEFEYGKEEEGFPQSVPCAESAAEIGTGPAPVALHADIVGLSPNTAYHFRIAATNALGSGKGQEQGFETFGPPRVSEGSASGVTDTTATLSGQVNPRGEATSYVIQYASAEEFEAEGFANATSVPSPPEGLGSGTSFLEVSQQISGLTPDTEYRFRLVATNPAGTTNGPTGSFATYLTFSAETSCPNQVLRTGPSAALPDCRAYEMVSPSTKVGEVFPPDPFGGAGCECFPGQNNTKMPMQSSADGEAFAYQGQPFAADLASGGNEYLAHRSPSGWTTQYLSPPVFEEGYTAFSPDLSKSLIFQGDPTLSPQAPSKEGQSYPNFYLRNEDGTLQPLVTEAPPHRDPTNEGSGNGFEITYAGTNAGMASTPAFSHVVFEADDVLTKEVPGIAPEAPETGASFCPGYGATCNAYEWFEGQLRLVNVLPGNTSAVPGAVIGSGHLLGDHSPYEAAAVHHAISDDGSRIFWSEANGQVYVRIDAKETLKIEDPGNFLTATPSGSKVLLSDGCLYDLAKEECEADLSQGEGERFKGILGAAEDLSRVYFVDTAVLTGTEGNANGEQAEEGRFNLYAWHEGVTTFIGILRAEDNQVTGGGSSSGDWRATPSNRTALVSADGRYLAFMSKARLTGYDNARGVGGRMPCDSSSEPLPGPLCFEVFTYDAVAENLTCASCNPTGEKPLGHSRISLISQGDYGNPYPQPDSLTGGRLFFESLDALSPRDTNGRIDVYEWEQAGVGGCKRAKGCISLISSGVTDTDSVFVDATASGNDAFIITRDRLVLRDKDDQLDLYDVRVGGGIAEDTTPPCLGDACKGPSSSPPEQQGPGSSTFAGPGNEKPKKHKHKKRRKHKSHHKRAAKHDRGGQK